MISIFITINGGAGTLINGQMTSEMETPCKQSIPNALQIGFEILEKGGTSVGAPFNTDGMYRDIRPMIVMIYKD